MQETKKMNRLEGLTSLKEKIAVYVPSTIDVNKKIDNSFYVHEILKEFSEIFGGATAYNASGAWVSSEKGLIIEDVVIVYSYSDKLTNNDIDKIICICEWLKDELKQECISLEVNDKLYFI